MIVKVGTDRAPAARTGPNERSIGFLFAYLDNVRTNGAQYAG